MKIINLDFDVTFITEAGVFQLPDLNKLQKLFDFFCNKNIAKLIRNRLYHCLIKAWILWESSASLKNKMKRIFDLTLSIILIIIFFIPLILIALLVYITSKGPVLNWSSRVGRLNVIFKMPKFRTMQVGTPILATHLLANSSQHLTLVGSFLRKTSLDELPQLWSILVGDMSFVGPRPALFNQDDLIILRIQYGLDSLVPGLTGWAQVNGRDELSIPVKVQYEVEYLERQSFWFDMKILGLTFLKVIKRVGISH